METKQLKQQMDHFVAGDYYLVADHVWQVVGKSTISNCNGRNMSFEIKFRHDPWTRPDSYVIDMNPNPNKFKPMTKEDVVLWKLAN